MALQNTHGSSVSCIDIGAGGFACSNGVVYDGLTDQYKNNCDGRGTWSSNDWWVECSDGAYFGQGGVGRAGPGFRFGWEKNDESWQVGRDRQTGSYDARGAIKGLHLFR